MCLKDWTCVNLIFSRKKILFQLEQICHFLTKEASLFFLLKRACFADNAERAIRALYFLFLSPEWLCSCRCILFPGDFVHCNSEGTWPVGCPLHFLFYLVLGNKSPIIKREGDGSNSRKLILLFHFSRCVTLALLWLAKVTPSTAKVIVRSGSSCCLTFFNLRIIWNENMPLDSWGC